MHLLGFFFSKYKLLISTSQEVPEYIIHFYGLENLFFLLIMIVMLDSGHMHIYTIYKQCLEEYSSKIISTLQHKCSAFQLFIDELAHNILGCDSRVCELSVSFASLIHLREGFLSGPNTSCFLGAVLLFSDEVKVMEFPGLSIGAHASLGCPRACWLPGVEEETVQPRLLKLWEEVAPPDTTLQVRAGTQKSAGRIIMAVALSEQPDPFQQYHLIPLNLFVFCLCGQYIPFRLEGPHASNHQPPVSICEHLQIHLSLSASFVLKSFPGWLMLLILPAVPASPLR